MRRVIDLVNGENITAEFVTTMLRAGHGSREGLQVLVSKIIEENKVERESRKTEDWL